MQDGIVYLREKNAYVKIGLNELRNRRAIEKSLEISETMEKQRKEIEWIEKQIENYKRVEKLLSNKN